MNEIAANGELGTYSFSSFVHFNYIFSCIMYWSIVCLFNMCLVGLTQTDVIHLKIIITLKLQ